MVLYKFIQYLVNGLIPDLKDAAMDGTAEDFEIAVKFLKGEETKESCFLCENAPVSEWVWGRHLCMTCADIARKLYNG